MPPTVKVHMKNCIFKSWGRKRRLSSTFFCQPRKQGTVHIGITQDKIKKVFEGEFKNNKPFKGIYLYEDNDEYNGELNENFEKHGKGKYISNKSKFEYEGEWLNDKRHGKGSYLTDGKKIEYEWENDIPIKKLTV